MNTVTENERLITIARRYAQIREDEPELNAMSIVNRMHAEGIDCRIDDVQAGEALIANTPGLSGMTTRQIGEAVGKTSKQVKAWFADPPDGFPPFEEAAKRGVVPYYVIDTALLREWVNANDE